MRHFFKRLHNTIHSFDYHKYDVQTTRQSSLVCTLSLMPNTPSCTFPCNRATMKMLNSIRGRWFDLRPLHDAKRLTAYLPSLESPLKNFISSFEGKIANKSNDVAGDAPSHAFGGSHAGKFVCPERWGERETLPSDRAERTIVRSCCSAKAGTLFYLSNEAASALSSGFDISFLRVYFIRPWPIAPNFFSTAQKPICCTRTVSSLKSFFAL